MNAALALPAYGTMQSQGTSSAASYVTEQFCKVRKRLRESHALLGVETTQLFDKLAAFVEECGEENWDGYGAEPVSETSYFLTQEFLDALPMGAAPTSVGAEPDGQMTLEWYRTPYRVLSVSVDPTGVLHYAALLGSSTRHGMEPFYGAVPKSILELIGQVAVR